MCNYARLLDGREMNQIFNIYVNHCNGYPQDDIFEMLIEAQDSKTVTIRDREWVKWAEDMALKVKAETLKEVGEWLQKHNGIMPKLNRNKCQRSKYIVKINNKELEAFNQGTMLIDE